MEPGVVVPLLFFIPAHPNDSRIPTVVAFAQAGKQQFLKQRSQAISDLLAGGVAVCLADLRGTGETSPKDRGRGRGGDGTTLSQAELMLGRTLLGEQLGDLRAVLRYLRGRNDIDAARLALWGDSFAPANAAGTLLEVPMDADKSPAISEPMGETLVLLGMLFEEDVRAGYASGGLAGFASCLQSPFCYFPHDAVVPGAMTAGDLGDVAAACAPRALRLAGMVDGQNRRVNAKTATAAFDVATAGYRATGGAGKFVVDSDEKDLDGVTGAAWMVRRLMGE